MNMPMKTSATMRSIANKIVACGFIMFVLTGVARGNSFWLDEYHPYFFLDPSNSHSVDANQSLPQSLLSGVEVGIWAKDIDDNLVLLSSAVTDSNGYIAINGNINAEIPLPSSLQLDESSTVQFRFKWDTNLATLIMTFPHLLDRYQLVKTRAMHSCWQLPSAFCIPANCAA